MLRARGKYLCGFAVLRAGGIEDTQRGHEYRNQAELSDNQAQNCIFRAEKCLYEDDWLASGTTLIYDKIPSVLEFLAILRFGIESTF